ncbi:hypothetical protein L4C33_08430 [Vibrio makurazakiensis]|uniref:hypothetical protein n=1 Tax=Vibrio makurazakiensis TaxID=2910250 RepID=UPI003D10E2D0
MLLEDVVEIIELTDTDLLSQAMEIFNEKGIVGATHFPFMNVVFDKAPEQLAKRLSDIGFKGNVQVTKCERTTSYVVFDAARIQLDEANQWPETA